MITTLSTLFYGDWASIGSWFDHLFSSSLWPIIRDFSPHILLAMFLGMFLGFERRQKHKVAGVRTHMVVAGASSLITLCGVYTFEKYGMGDPARLAAQILAGLGFIGAGVILRRGFNTSGVTTAATILFAAGIGMSCGFGFYAMATVSSMFMVLALWVTYRFFPSQETGGHTLSVTCTRAKYEETKKLFGPTSKVDNITKHGDNIEFRIHTELTSDQVDNLLSDLVENVDVVSVVLLDEPTTGE
jgi:putative Mg2+ transporter-C (MgtC) family protein